MTSSPTTDPKLLSLALRAQQTEATEAEVYATLASLTDHEENARILAQIAREEKEHAAFWETRTRVHLEASHLKKWWYVFLARILGLTFVLKLMENREEAGADNYKRLAEVFPEAAQFSQAEEQHEQELLAMLDEERLAYMGSVVLGLNDALVELTGALAGFTLALSNPKVISLAGLVTGISAALSMSASEYLSSKTEGNKKAHKSALYTGVAYIVTVMLLILPYLLLSHRFLSLGITVAIAVFVILCFNYYLAVAKELDFKTRFAEMAGISLGVAVVSFLIGWGLKAALGVDL
ncbi:MAG: VIT1/CCC1 transporter family protein [Thermoleophilia bacterium]|nr:VIT1/CCC1 transporter family protein [Thermoleophilia bacterium]